MIEVPNCLLEMTKPAIALLFTRNDGNPADLKCAPHNKVLKKYIFDKTKD